VALVGAITPPVAVSIRPERPEQGSLAVISLASSDRLPEGAAAGEPVHFYTDSAGYWAILGIPLFQRDSLPVTIETWHADFDVGGSSETTLVYMPVVPRSEPGERLHVAPRFAEPVDSALLERVTREREIAREARARSQDMPRLWTHAFLRPVAGRVTSPFAAHRAWPGNEADTAPGAFHDGVDLAGAAGTRVRVANRGVVVIVGDWYYGGTVIFVDHGGGLVTAYQHLSRVEVAVGDTVARGQVIGLVGATGRVTGPHLHWSASYGTVLVDPLSLLTLAIPD
jgi:murein DD-endopeptidase MepM/ murein hydrolase activator NlpD